MNIAAHLHDIGKIGVPDAVLNKEGKLDDEEWEAMKKHPSIGAAPSHIHISDPTRLSRRSYAVVCLKKKRLLLEKKKLVCRLIIENKQS